MVFLLYQWRRDHPHFPCNTNEGNWLHLSILKDNGQAGSSSSVDKSINGLLCGGDAMEVDGPPDLSDAKLLQGGALTAGSLAAGSLAAGSLAAGSLALPAEHSFVSSLLDDCGHPEQRRFALAYRKWLGTISRQ